MTTISPTSDLSAWRAETRATLTLALPLIGVQLSQIAVLTTDVLMMGWLSAAALAAGALGFNLYFILWGVGLGVLIGTSPMMAQAIGRKRHMVRELRRTLRQGLWMAIAIGGPTMVVIWHAEPILRALGQDPVNAEAAQHYTRALAWGVLPSLGFIALRQLMAALERPRATFVVQVLTLIVNAGACYALMFGKLGLPALGLVGAGYATAFANTFSFLALLGFVLWDRRLRRFSILGRFWRADWPRFREILRVGLPIAGSMTLEIGAFSGAVYLMGMIGTPELAAHQIAIQCAATTFMVPLAIGQAATVRVGIFAGARDDQGVRRAGWIAFGVGVGFMAVMALVVLAVREDLVALFLGGGRPDDARTAALAVAYLGVAAAFQLFDGAQAVGMGVLRGLKDTRMPMLFAALGYWVIGLPLGAVAAWGFHWGGVGIWFGLALGLAIVAALVLIRFHRRRELGLSL